MMNKNTCNISEIQKKQLTAFSKQCEQKILTLWGHNWAWAENFENYYKKMKKTCNLSEIQREIDWQHFQYD